MAEGGEFGMEQTDLDNRLDHDDKDDEQKVVNTTRPFKPGTASTPYHGGEEIEMQTRKQEQSGLPEITFDEDIPLLGSFIHQDDKPALLERAKDFIKRRFPRVEFGKLDPIGFSKKPGNETTIVSLGKKVARLTFSEKMGKVFSKNLQTSSKHPLVQKLNLCLLKTMMK